MVAAPTPTLSTIFDNLDYLTINIMLPLGGLLIAVFAGWVMCRNSTADELGGAGNSYKLWRVLVRFVAPIVILFVLLNETGMLDYVVNFVHRLKDIVT